MTEESHMGFHRMGQRGRKTSRWWVRDRHRDRKVATVRERARLGRACL